MLDHHAMQTLKPLKRQLKTLLPFSQIVGCVGSMDSHYHQLHLLPQNAIHISSVQTWKISEQNRELAAAGLDSSILSPFSEKISEFREHEFAPSATLPLDPSSEEYYLTLLKALALDSPKYAHVDAEILLTFKQLIRKYPTGFLLPGSPLGQIQGFEHHIDTEDALPVYKHPYRKSPEELLAIKNELQRMLKMKIIQPSKSGRGHLVFLSANHWKMAFNNHHALLWTIET